MIVIGLTGSIGMGKSTVARMFAAAGVPVFDADAEVHRLYAGALAPVIEAAFPGTVRDGVVDRQRLSSRVIGDKAALARLNDLVHPAVHAAEQAFIAAARAAGAPAVVLDIPLLFETGRDREVDRTVVVSATPELQRQRVLAREGMSEDKFVAILDRQWSDVAKRSHADHVIDTSGSLEATEAEVRRLIALIVRG